MITRKRLFALLVLLVFIIALKWINLGPGNAQAVNRVGLVIQYEENVVVTQCIHFSENRITGYDVLQRAGVEIEEAKSPQGVAICKIENQGCPANSCFCTYPNYWSYWHLEGNRWQYSPLGASSYYVEDGDVEGWRWGKGDPPVMLSFTEICALAIDTPTPTHLPSMSSPATTPTLTPVTSSILYSTTFTQSNLFSSNSYPPPATPYTPPAYPPPGQPTTSVPLPQPSQPTHTADVASTPTGIAPSPTWTVAPTLALIIPTALTPPPFDLEKTETYRIIATATALALINSTEAIVPEESTSNASPTATSTNENVSIVTPLPNSTLIGYLLSGVILFIFAVGVFLLIVKQTP